jgi:hypothetical protein
MCIRHDHVNMGDEQARKNIRPLATSKPRRWYTGTYAEIAHTRLSHMGKNEFENVIAEFSLKFESLKQLARQLRNVLSPIRDGAVFAGTFRENGIMYDRMIKTFLQGNWSSGEWGTGKCMGEVKAEHQHWEAYLIRTVLGETVRYNNTIEVKERVTCYIPTSCSDKYVAAGSNTYIGERKTPSLIAAS